MPVVEGTNQVLLGQERFAGVDMLNPTGLQLAKCKNMVMRDGYPETRGGVRQHLSADDSFLLGFYFNEENAKMNDATHTGFWFPFDFVSSPWTGAIQGAEQIRLSIHDENKVIFAVGGSVYIYERGYLTIVPTTPSIGSTETLVFEQATDEVYMFRSGGAAPLVWDGGDAGFVLVADAAVGDDIPHADNGVYHQGRMWVTVEDEAQASASLDFTEWDIVKRLWSVEKGGAKAGVILFPFNEDIMLAFKKDRVQALRRINSVIAAGTDLSDYVTQQTVVPKGGCEARNAIVRLGENVWYLDRIQRGIFSLQRNAESKMERDPVAVSAPMQPEIDRINWPAATGACAGVHDNYVIFAVPVDGSTTNNMLLVWDQLLNQWIGTWESPTLNPIKFWHDGEKFIFLSSDHRVREMFSTDPWDSESPLSDTPAYVATETYEPARLVQYDDAGQKIYRCTVTTLGNLPTDTDFWEEVPDVWTAYDIESELQVRQLKIEPGNAGILPGQGEVLLRHQDPKLTLSKLGNDYSTEVDIVTDAEFDRTKYDVVLPDWDPTNVNLDAAVPHRRDYTLKVDDQGIMADAAGLQGGVWETHAIPFVPTMLGDRSTGFRLVNKRGKVKLMGLGVQAAVLPQGHRAVV
jgi:hypothetical protein